MPSHPSYHPTVAQHQAVPPSIPPKVPYNLSCRGYVADPNTPNRFINPDGHPFYSITIDPDRRNHDGDTVRAMLQAAFDAGALSREADIELAKKLSLPISPSI